MTGEPGRRPEDAGAPPVGGSWRNLYSVVVLELAVVVLLLWLLTRAFG